MGKLHDIMSNPKVWRKYHGFMTVFWQLMIIPGILFWKDSVLYVIIMSCYANSIGHFASWQGARAEDSNGN